MIVHVSFFVAGTPCGQPRVKACRIGNHTRVYTPAGQHQTWRELIMLQAAQIDRTWPADAAVTLSLNFCMPRPKSHTGKKGLHPWAPKANRSKPDIDNLVKLVMDALTEMRWWDDDAQVCKVIAIKYYSGVDEQVGCLVDARFGDLWDEEAKKNPAGEESGKRGEDPNSITPAGPITSQ
jgi:Holliday junction resolvase RusA-like endonuclease